MRSVANSGLDCDSINLASLRRSYEITGRTVALIAEPSDDAHSVIPIEDAWTRLQFVPRPLQIRRIHGSLWLYHCELATLLGPVDEDCIGELIADLCDFGVAKVDGPIRVMGQPMWGDYVLGVRPRSLECLTKGYQPVDPFCRYIPGHGGMNRGQFDKLNQMVQSIQQWINWSLNATKNWDGAISIAKASIPGWFEQRIDQSAEGAGYSAKLQADFEFGWNEKSTLDSKPLYAAYSVGRHLIDRLSVTSADFNIETLIAIGSQFCADLSEGVALDKALKDSRALITCIVDTNQTKQAVVRAFRFLETNTTLLYKRYPVGSTDVAAN